MKTTISEKEAINEGLRESQVAKTEDLAFEELFEKVRPGIVISFANVSEISQSLCNGLPTIDRMYQYEISNLEEIAKPDCVYMATNSFGGRVYSGEPRRHLHNGMSGFAEFGSEDAQYFEWESATSGAQLKVSRLEELEDSWLLEFREGYDESQVYAGIFRNLARLALKQELDTIR
ncbi:MAG: hypothetical protein WCP03_00240 [Candidatus Saccharibacteria bacterium]